MTGKMVITCHGERLKLGGCEDDEWRTNERQGVSSDGEADQGL